MLSAFEAQPIHKLKPQDKAKIESLLRFGDRLLVGLNTGVLRIYRVNENSGTVDTGESGGSVQTPTKRAVDLLQEHEKFSRKPVQQLAIVKEANLLVSLSDAYVSLHDLRSFQLVERIEQSRGAAGFAVTSNVIEDPETKVQGLVSRLAVGVKKKIICWTWQDMEQLPGAIEMTVEANIKSVNWVTSTKLVVGMDPGFSIIDVGSQEITVVNKPASRASNEVSSQEPSGVRFGAVSSSGMGYMGMSSWVPKPMVTALTGDQVLLAKDVNTLFTDTSGQALEKRQVPWSLAPEAVGYSYPYLLALQPQDKGVLQIRNPDTLSLIQSISVPGASTLHVPQPNISLAHAGKGFLVASDRVIWRMNALPYHTQIAELLAQQRFDEAISLLNLLEDTLIDDKAGRICAIMIEKGIALFSQRNYRPALDIFIDAEAPPERIIALYPPSIAGKLAGSSDETLEADSLTIAVRCLCSFLAQARVQIQKYLTTDGTLKENPPRLDDETRRPPFGNLLSSKLFNCKSEDVDWQKELLEVARLVDTTLFKSYMLAMPVLAGSLFRLDNFCDPEVVQSVLYDNERYDDLIDFLLGKKLHRQALEMLSRFGKGEASGKVPEGMQGPERTVTYLKQLHPELLDVILEYGQWPIEERPEIGMEVFLADNDKADKFPRWKVAKFLEGIDRSLEIRYIEHIINEWTETDPDFHQQLIDLYLINLRDGDLDEPSRNALKAKLEAFLHQSKVYDKSKTIRQLSANDPTFFEARAIVLSAMGNYKEALSIYVFKIKDYEKAEKYCNKAYAEQQVYASQNVLGSHDKISRQLEPEDTPDKPNLFAILLGLYLDPPANEEKRWPQALDLLARHGPRLPTSSTLEKMPSDLAIKELQSYFRGRIQNSTSILREEQILSNLELVRRTEAERLLLLGPEGEKGEKPMGRNRRFRVGEDDHCKVCHKRFGASAVRVYPNNEVVHYGCVSGNGLGAAKGRLSDSGFSHLRQSSGWGRA